MGFLKRFFKSVLATAVLMGSMTFGTAQTGVAPNVRFLETDQSLPDGLWRIRLDGDVFSIQKNTNASNNFSTTIDAITIAANGDVTIPNDFFVTGSATVTVDTTVNGQLLVGALGSDGLDDIPPELLAVVGGDIKIYDPGFLAGETFTEGDFTTTVNWNFGADWTNTAGTMVYLHVGGSAQLFQTNAQHAIGTKQFRMYEFSYTVSAITNVGTNVCFIPSEENSQFQVDVPIDSAGTFTIVYQVTGDEVGSDFIFECESDTAGDGFTIDNFTLKEIDGGDLLVAGKLTGGGDQGITIDGLGNATFDEQIIISTSQVEALLVRRDNDAGDVFWVDTNSDPPEVYIESQSVVAALSGPDLNLRRSRAGATVITGDVLGGVDFFGHDGTSFIETAAILAFAEGTIATTRVPSRLSFFTGTDAAPTVLSLSQIISQSTPDVLGREALTTSFVEAGNFSAFDSTDQALESLTDPNDATTANWFRTGDISAGTSNVVYLHSSGTGSLRQDNGDMAILKSGLRWYKFTYTVSSVTAVGNLTAEISNTWGQAGGTPLDVSSAATRTLFFRTGSSCCTLDFTIDGTSDTAGDGFTLDTFELKEILGGNVNVNNEVRWGDDVKLVRDGPWELALRDGNFANYFLIYDQFTDFNNYERLRMGSGGGAEEFFIQTETAGTGEDSVDLRITAVGPTAALRFILDNQSLEFSPGIFSFSGATATTISTGGGISAGTLFTVGASVQTPTLALQILVSSTGIASPGTRNSQDLLFKAFADAGPGLTTIDWRNRIVSVNNDGTDSLWTLTEELNAGGENTALTVSASEMSLPATSSLDWGGDVKLFRDAPWELALRDGTNDNFFHIYGTFTDDMNYNRLSMYAGSDANFFIEAIGVGTGAGNMHLDIIANSDIEFLPNSSTSGNRMFMNSTQLVLDKTDRTGAGTTDSYFFDLTGLTFDGSAHDADWRQFVDPTSNAGVSNYVFQSRIDAAGFATRFTISDAGNATFTGNLSGVDLTLTGNLIFAGTPAGAGTIRLAQTDFIGIRNFADNADIAILGLGGGGDVVQLGGSNASGVQVNSVGPHAYGGTVANNVRNLFFGSYTSGGLTTISTMFEVSGTLVGANGDISALYGVNLNPSIATQTFAEGVDTIISVRINEPQITDNLIAGTITNATTLHVVGEPSEATNNLAFRVAAGKILLEGPATSDGATTTGIALRAHTSLQGASGDTDALYLFSINSSIDTQGDTESIEHISALFIDEPDISDSLGGAGDIANAAALIVARAPTEAAGTGSLNTAVLIGTQQTGTYEAIVIDQLDRSGTGRDDSGKIVLTGVSHDGAPHDADWIQFVDVTTNAGASQWTLQSRIDAGVFANRFTLTDAGAFQFVSSGPHAIGDGPNNSQLRIAGTRTSTNGGQTPAILTLDGVLVGIASDSRIEVVSIFTVVETQPSEVVADVSGIVISDLFTTIGGGGSVTREQNLLIDRIGTAGDETYGIRILTNQAGGSTAAIIIEADPLSGDGQLDSEAILLRGQSFVSAAPHSSDWQQFVDVTSGAGLSAWTLQERVDGASFVTHVTVKDDGGFTAHAESPHSFGGVTTEENYFQITGAFLTTNPGGFSTAFMNNVGLTGGVTDTSALLLQDIDGSIATQTATESIANIASLQINEPDISDNLTGGGLITQASTLRIVDAPSEGVANFALLVESGTAQFGGQVNHEGNSFFQGTLDIDVTNTQAFLVRKDGDTGDLFFIDTTNDEIEFPTGTLIIGLQTTGTQDAIVIDQVDRSGDGLDDSGAIIMTGVAFESATPHDADWKTFVDVTANTGLSTWTLQEQIDAGGFSSMLTLDEGGKLIIHPGAGTVPAETDAGTVLVVNGNTGSTANARIVIVGGQPNGLSILAFGNELDEDRGNISYSHSQEEFTFRADNTESFIMGDPAFTSFNANGFRLENGTSSATNPTLAPDRAANSTGMGGVTGTISLITGGAEAVNISSTQLVRLGVLGSDGLDQTPPELLTVLGGDMEILDPSVQAAETLQDGDFSSFANWNDSNDFNEGTLNYAYLHSSGAGQLVQTDPNLSIGVLRNRWYEFTYTISAVTEVGTTTCIFPDEEMSLGNLTIDVSSAATRTVLFQATFENAPDFSLTCTSDTGGDGFTIDDVTLKEIVGGDLVVNGTITGGGGTGLIIDTFGVVTAEEGLIAGTEGIIIDTTITEAFLVRKNNDAGDIFSINSSTGEVLAGTLIAANQTFEALPETFSVAEGNLEVMDTGTLGSETITDGAFPDSTNWAGAVDWSDTISGNTTYTHSGGNGTLTQTAAQRVTGNEGESARWYQITYTVSAVTETGATVLTITNAFANAAVTLDVSSAATRTAIFQTHATTAGSADFVFSATSTTGGDTFTLDDVTLFEVQGGDAIIAGLITGGGTAGLKVFGTGSIAFTDEDDVSQGTDINTAVTVTGTSGTITTQSASTAIGNSDSFVVTATRLRGVDDVVNVSIQSYSGTLETNGLPVVLVSTTTATTFTITIMNVDGTNSLSGTFLINYAIINTGSN